MFQNKLSFTNRAFPRCKKKWHQHITNATVDELWTSKLDKHVHEILIKIKCVWKRQKGERESDWLWSWIHSGMGGGLTFISAVMLTGKCHRLQNQQKNARLKHYKEAWSRTGPPIRSQCQTRSGLKNWKSINHHTPLTCLCVRTHKTFLPREGHLIWYVFGFLRVSESSSSAFGRMRERSVIGNDGNGTAYKKRR